MIHQLQKLGDYKEYTSLCLGAGIVPDDLPLFLFKTSLLVYANALYPHLSQEEGMAQAQADVAMAHKLHITNITLNSAMNDQQVVKPCCGGGAVV